MSFDGNLQPTSSLSNSTDSKSYLDNFANSIVRVKGLKGIAGFLFDVPDNDSINLNWDVTDHFTESNSFLNDTKVKKPAIITLSGFVGELVFRAPEGIEGSVQEISNRLETVEAYLGDFTPGAVQEAQRVVQQAQSAISAINQTLDKIGNIAGFFAGDGPQETEQQRAYRTLATLGDEVVLSAQTPWEFFDDMTIMAIGVSQDGKSNQITDISVTLKQIRVSDTKTVDFDQTQFPIREEVQSGPEEDQGNIRGQDVNSSILFRAFGSSQ